MALKLSTQYANTIAASTSYPSGSFKNETVDGALDGTPLEKAWQDDLQGLVQSILVAANITATGSADTVLTPQYLAGIFNLRYYSRVDYKVGTTVTGSNGAKYVCQQPNGPASTIADPVTEGGALFYWYTEQAVRFSDDNPVGSIKMTSYTPHNFPAGAWTQTMIGRFPVGVDASDALWNQYGRVGGAKIHAHAPGTLAAAGTALTIAQMPAHTHSMSFETVENDGGATGTNLNNSQTPAEFTGTTSSVGGASSHGHSISGVTATQDNLPPFQAVFYWIRTS
jgi:hypothetical protein